MKSPTEELTEIAEELDRLNRAVSEIDVERYEVLWAWLETTEARIMERVGQVQPGSEEHLDLCMWWGRFVFMEDLAEQGPDVFTKAYEKLIVGWSQFCDVARIKGWGI